MAKSNGTTHHEGAVVLADDKCAGARTFENDDAPVAVETLRRVGELLGVDQVDTPADHADCAVRAFNHAQLWAVRAGWHLLALKQGVEHGEFGKALDERQLTRERAAELMRIARMACELPEREAREFAALPKTKATMLASADPDVVRRRIADGSAKALNTRQLHDELRKEREAKEKLQREHTVALSKLKAAEHRAAYLDYTGSLPPFCVRARHESAALSEQISLALNALQEVVDEVAQQKPATRNDLATQRAIELAAEALHRNAQGVAAMAVRLMDHCRAQLPVPSPEDGIAPEALMTDEERERFINTRATMLEMARVQKANRQQERDIAHGRGRGRPRKS